DRPHDGNHARRRSRAYWRCRRWIHFDGSRRAGSSRLPERPRLPLCSAPLGRAWSARPAGIHRRPAHSRPGHAAGRRDRGRSCNAPHRGFGQSPYRNGHLSRGRCHRQGGLTKPMRRLMAAIQFLTRIPVPAFTVSGEEDVGKSLGFFPAVGLIVGAGGCLLYYAMKTRLPASTCVILVLIYSALITNAFHDDGLADSIDGFGAGWTREQTL